MKECIKCNQSQDLSRYYKDKTRKDGLAVYCKSCMKKIDNARYDKDPEKRKESSRKYYSLNKNKVFNRISEYRKRDSEREKVNSRSKLQQKIDNGEIIKRNSCEFCYNGPTQNHHKDYSKPYEFIEMCERCHKLLHKQERRARLQVS